MKNNYNLIIWDETCYGFIDDIINYLKSGETDEVVEDAIKEATRIKFEEDELDIWSCTYSPMGGFYFEKYVREVK